MSINSIVIVVKQFGKRGSWFYQAKTNELAYLTQYLEAIKKDCNTQIVAVKGKEGYPEYAPYTEVGEPEDLINIVKSLN